MWFDWFRRNISISSPFGNSQIYQVKKRSIIITLSTNAHFRGFQETIEPILPYIDNLQFSVDGIGETYNSIRKGADFNTVKENIQFVMQKGKNVVCMINCVVMPENYL